MPIITNKHNLPETLIRFIKHDKYSRGDARKSVTQLIGPPRIDVLRGLHADDMTFDAVDRIWSLLGTAVHHVLESGAGETDVAEERLYAELLGWRISGGVDLQEAALEEDANGVTITDYKVTGVWSVQHDKPEWEYQLNSYAYLIETARNRKVIRLRICAILRDWLASKAEYDPAYPQVPVQLVEIPLWSMDRRRGYLEGRIMLHQDAWRAQEWDEDLPECTDEERWLRGEQFAVYKTGNKRPTKVFDNHGEAQAFMAELPQDKATYYVMKRPGTPIRCERNFCGVAEWCSQYARWKEELPK